MDARGNDPAGVFSWGIDDDDLVDNNVNNFFEENNENNYLFGEFAGANKDATLFLVDCTQGMFQQCVSNDDDDENNRLCLFQKCMKAIQNIYQTKIYGSDKDLLGVVFFGTQKSNTSADFNCIYTLQDLEQPSAERIKQIEALSANFDPKDFDENYGHSDGFKLDQVLWWCSNLFSNITQKIRTKRIILFTKRDNPHESDKTLQKLAKNKAKDLNDVGIFLEIVPVIMPTERFDFTKFYGDLLMLSEEEMRQLPDPVETFEELEKAVRSKDHKRRPYTNLKLSLGEGVNIACSIFNLVRECPKPSKIKLDKKTNVETKSVVRQFNPETGEILFKSDTKLAVDVFDKRIAFEQDEVKSIKSFGPPGLKLLGFKPIESLDSFVYIKPGHLLYPDEKIIEGSTTLFKCLLDKTLEKGKYILCEMTARRFTPPRMVALIPQKEELDENKFQVRPPGFNVIYLPYADDIREIDRKITKTKSEEHVETFSKVINKLKFKYCPEDFKNPALLKLWSEIEAIALARVSSEEVVDLTQPDTDKIDKRAGQFLEEFSQAFGLGSAGAATSASKRKGATDEESGGLLKKPKVKEEATTDVETEAKNGKLDKLTVVILKQYMKDKGIAFNGTAKKDDLIRLIKKHLKL